MRPVVWSVDRAQPSLEVLNLITVDTVSRCDALVGLIHKLLGKDTQIK